jgi:hypothetical protein
MSNHTPGDWRIEPCEGGYQIWDESGTARIATVYSGVLPDATGLANARLIAAAPKMLAACDSARKTMCGLFPVCGADPGGALDWGVAELNAVIALTT